MIGDAGTIGPATDQALDQLLESLTTRIQRGEVVDIEACIAAHPDYSDNLRRLLPAMQMLVAFGGSHGEASPVDAATLPGGPTRVLGDFRIGREIGRGGMGVVYEAEQISLGRRVALKVLPFAALSHDKALQRFRNEVRAAAALDHPHIVAVYSVGEDRGVHYYAMQLIRGQSLAEVISSLQKPAGAVASAALAQTAAFVTPQSSAEVIPTQAAVTGDSKRDTQVAAGASTLPDDPRRFAEHVRWAARLGAQAADALQHAHDQGVIHRDVKPGNLLLDATGKLFITDFGLARIQADAGMTMTGDVVGTLRYMAPEQALAKRVVIDYRADVYSLGATLYELLALQPAFSETDRSELLKQIAFEEPRPLRRCNRRIPTDVETIVAKAMSKNPDDRYQTAEEVRDDFQRFLDDKPIAARAPSIWKRARRWARSHRVTAWAVAAAAMTLLVVASLASLAINTIRKESSAQLLNVQQESQIRRDAEETHRSQMEQQLVATLEKVRRYGADPATLEQLAPCEAIFGHLEAYWHDYFNSLVNNYEIVRDTAHPVEAERLEREMIRVLEHWASHAPEESWVRYYLANSQITLARRLITARRFDDADQLLTLADRYLSVARDVNSHLLGVGWQEEYGCVATDCRTLSIHVPYCRARLAYTRAYLEDLRGNAQVAQQRFDEAIAILASPAVQESDAAKLPKREHDLGGCWLHKGLLFMRSEQWETAADCFRRAREEYLKPAVEDPSNGQGYASWQLCVCLIKLGRFDEAKAIDESTSFRGYAPAGTPGPGQFSWNWSHFTFPYMHPIRHGEPVNSNPLAVLLGSQMHMSLGQSDAGRDAYRLAAELLRLSVDDACALAELRKAALDACGADDPEFVRLYERGVYRTAVEKGYHRCDFGRIALGCLLGTADDDVVQRFAEQVRAVTDRGEELADQPCYSDANRLIAEIEAQRGDTPAP